MGLLKVDINKDSVELGFRLLCQEDEPDTVRATILRMERALRKRGVSLVVDWANSLAESREFLAQHPYSFLWFDARMPERKNEVEIPEGGIEVLEELKSGGIGTVNKDKPFIMVSQQPLNNKRVADQPQCLGVFYKGDGGEIVEQVSGFVEKLLQDDRQTEKYDLAITRKGYLEAICKTRCCELINRIKKIPELKRALVKYPAKSDIVLFDFSVNESKNVQQLAEDLLVDESDLYSLKLDLGYGELEAEYGIAIVYERGEIRSFGGDYEIDANILSMSIDNLADFIDPQGDLVEENGLVKPFSTSGIIYATSVR